jgi:hypothetical protein
MSPDTDLLLCLTLVFACHILLNRVAPTTLKLLHRLLVVNLWHLAGLSNRIDASSRYTQVRVLEAIKKRDNEAMKSSFR